MFSYTVHVLYEEVYLYMREYIYVLLYSTHVLIYEGAYLTICSLIQYTLSYKYSCISTYVPSYSAHDVAGKLAETSRC